MNRKDAIAFVLFLLTTLVVGLGLIAYISYVAATSLNVASDVLKSLIDADVGLLGLFGVVAVYVLTTYHSLGRRTEDQIDRLVEEHEHKKEVVAGYSDQLEVEYREYKKAIGELQNRFDELQSDSQGAIWFILFSAIAFIVSILLALGGMGEIASYVRGLIIYSSCFSFVFGVMLIIFLIYTLGIHLKLRTRKRTV